MRAHFLQHVPFEGFGSIQNWLASRGASVTRTRFFEDPRLPGGSDIDLLIAMGGPMSVNDEKRFPWLIPEKRFIRSAIENGKAVLGVCLGAQLIAGALGARVYPNREKEIGWFPIRSVLPAENDRAFRFPDDCVVFHWHGETFDLPQDAVLLASSEACRNQAFQVGGRVIGLQFHLEVTPEAVRDMARGCRNELIPSRYVQTEETILSSPEERFSRINSLMDGVLSYLVQGWGEGS
ncbi:MAG TPA: type 1 glutamine amidotransferase [Thermodesulfobacteriota bacterium]|nr:type 1 glutamine amidotransferase [Thermodesulfobacteriota bacterium]